MRDLQLFLRFVLVRLNCKGNLFCPVMLVNDPLWLFIILYSFLKSSLLNSGVYYLIFFKNYKFCNINLKSALWLNWSFRSESVDCSWPVLQIHARYLKTTVTWQSSDSANMSSLLWSLRTLQQPCVAFLFLLPFPFVLQ